MGQKTDARIFRQGVIKKNWDFKYIEKNNEESSLFLYKTIEIKKYLNKFFELYKMKISSCKIFYSNSSLQIFVSFYISTKTIYLIKKKLTKTSKKLLTLRKLIFFNNKKKKNKEKLRLKLFKKNKKKPRYRSRSLKQKLQTKKLQKIKNKKNLLINKLNLYKTVNLKGFQEMLLESLATYTKNKINISLTLYNLNNHKRLKHAQIKNLKIIFKQLKKFVRNSFFKEAINILFINISKRKSAKLLADFLSNQFKLNQLRTDQMNISRKDNYFLGFLKQTIMLLIKSEISCLTGLKIVISGRFNRVPRAKTRSIQFGKFSLQSFNSKIDYYQSTAYTINGTFGIKVWLCESYQ